MARNRKVGPSGEVVCASRAARAVMSAENASRRSDLRRSALLGTVAAGMLLFGYGRPAQAGPGPCVGGATVTCTGDQSDGITNQGATPDFTTPPTTSLNVNGLTQDIAPAPNVEGIYFFSINNVTINSDTADGPGGPFVITTTGNNAAGVAGVTSAGTTTITHTGDIFTSGNSSPGIVGLGAGSARVTHTGDISTRGDGSHGIYAYSDFGSAIVNQTGDISTRGDFALGILAYSFSGSASVKQTGTITTTGYRSHGIVADASGAAKVTHTGSISTRGHFAYGIYAYSVDGPITIKQTGDITTKGRFADGIYAYSDDGSAITVTHQGDITTTGAGADAIDVDNPNGAGSSVVTIKSGSTITGGTGSGDGVDFDGGITNRLINFGTITTLGENAIEGEGSGAEIVDNYGTVTGNVHLGPGANRFNNKSGGLFNAGKTVFIGDGNLLQNAGTLSPGGAGKIRTTALTGKMVQTSSGTFAVDLNLGNATTDRVNVSGTAKLNGTVKVAVQNPALLKQEFVILSAAGGTTDNGLGLLASPALQAELLFPNANDVVLGIDVDFAPNGLNRNQTHIGENLNDVLGAGGGTLGPVFDGLFNVFTLNAYADALDQLSPEIYADTEIAALYAAFDFSDSLLSCHVNGAETAAINYEGQCLWVGGKGRFIDGDKTSEYIGFDETAVQFAGGAQFALNSVWRLGLGAGYQASTLSTDTNATSDGDQLQGGVALKYNPGALLLAGVFSGGHGWYDTTRPMNFGGFTETARADHDIDILQGRLHASYVLGSPGLYYKPMLDAAVTDVALDDVRETGAGGASLLVDGDNHTVFSVSPALEFGTEWWWSNGTLVRPYVRGGLTWYSEDDVTVSASFSGAPAGVSPFAITAGTDEVQADVAAGLEMIDTHDSALRIFYDGHFGDRLAVHAGGLKASVKF